MTLADLFADGRVFVLRAADKQAALDELSRRAAEALDLRPVDVAAALGSREALGSTGVGSGIAVPHARLDSVVSPSGFFARLERAVDWGAIDRRPVDLVFLLLSPVERDSDHLAALAAGTRRLRDAAAAAKLRATNGTALRDVLVRD